jgi:hypothetical protein
MWFHKSIFVWSVRHKIIGKEVYKKKNCSLYLKISILYFKGEGLKYKKIRRESKE